MLAKLHWNPWDEFWIMRSPQGAFMEELRDCLNVRRLYRGLDKKMVNVVNLRTGKVVEKYPRWRDDLPELPA